ncbi:MAG TPA: hypothetical protein VFP21_02145 [Solirubrobacterales bacterium]|nr:hypothetical protein [Solirubrobacterales bacterium]
MKRRRIPYARTFLTLAFLLSGWLGAAAASLLAHRLERQPDRGC